MNIIVPHGFETNYVAGFALGLKANGVGFVLLSSDADEKVFTARGIDNINLRGSVAEDRSWHTKVTNLARYYARLFRYLLAHRKSTVHFIGIFRNELLLFEGLVLPLLFKLMARRYIYTAHNVLPHGKSDLAFYRWIYRWVYRFPDVIVVNTELAGDQLVDSFGVPRRRVRVSSIGFNDQIPSTGLARDAARKRLELAADAKVLLFFGKISYYKGLDLLIDALEQIEMPELKLVIAGSFTDAGYRSSIVDQIERSVRCPGIVLHDRHVPNEEVEVYFNAADALVLPYRDISQSGLIFLAMRFGLPVLASDVGSMKAYVEPDMGLVAPSADAAGIAHTIREFFARPGRFDSERIMAKGRTYRWDEVCSRLRSLYE